MRTCKRCQEKFDPSDVPVFKPGSKPTHCCSCQLRNLFDAFDMPTPPELLDQYTKHPALTTDEYNRMMAEMKERDEKEEAMAT